MITTHSFDLSVTPAQIVWAKRDVTVDERKETLKGIATVDYRKVISDETAKELSDDPSQVFDASVVTQAQTTYQNALTAIAALTTHEDVDGYGS